MDGPPKEQLGPPAADAAKAETRLRGHLGHLTKNEDAALTAFKDLSTKQGLYKPATAGSKASHDDGTLVRYLRARKFVPQDAFVQFKDTEIWRKQNDLEALYERIDIKDYWESRSVYPQWTGRRDKRGIPVYLYDVSKLDTKKMATYTSSTSKSKEKGPSPSKMLRLFALYENLTRFVMPLCTAAPGRPNPETPVDQSNNIVDISKVGLKQFWNLRSHMQDASQLATAHYPETLDRIFILGAPSFFPTVWSWIKRWFDPITTSKIFVLSQHEALPTLSQFINIEDIPKRYGGQLQFECGDMPNLDPELRDCITISPGSDTERYFLTGPVRWVDAGEIGEMEAIGVGSVDGKQRKEHVATLHSLATRVATHTERLSRATTQQSQLPLTPLTAGGLTPNRPVSQSHYFAPTTDTSAPTLQPPTAALAHMNINEQPAHPVQNGGPPAKIAVPSRPVDLERQNTEFMTPPSDPSELKTLA